MTKTNVSVIELTRQLRGIDFPVNKEELIQYARDNNADEAVLREMEAMADQEFRSMRDVTRAIGHSGDAGGESDEEETGGRGGRQRGGER